MVLTCRETWRVPSNHGFSVVLLVTDISFSTLAPFERSGTFQDFHVV